MKALSDVFGAEMAEGGFIGMFSPDVCSSDSSDVLLMLHLLAMMIAALIIAGVMLV